MQQFIATQESVSRQYCGLQRLAWTMLVASFLIFAIVVITLPYAINWAIDRIRQDVSVPVQVISGQVYILTAGSPSWVVRSESTQLNPGDSISTHETAQAFFVLPDGSTVHMYPDSQLKLATSNIVRYRPEKVQITLEQERGYSRIAIAPVVEPEERIFTIRAPTLVATVQEGSYAVEVIGESRSSLAARLGSAEVTDGQRVLEISAGERATTVDGRLPAEPLPATQDLILMGDFTALSPDWKDIWREEDRSEGPAQGQNHATA